MPASNPHFLTTPDTLTRAERKLFDVLASEPHQVFSKQQLLDAGVALTPRELDSRAFHLRTKLADFDGRRAVVNVWGVGYRMSDPLSPS